VISTARGVLWRTIFDRVVAALDGSGSLELALRHLIVVAQRLQPPRPEAIDLADLLGLLSRLRWVIDHALVDLDADSWSDLEHHLAGLLGSLVTTPRHRADVIEAMIADPQLALLLARHHHHFPTGLLFGVTSSMITRALKHHHSNSSAEVVGVLLAVIAREPQLAASLLSDADVLEALARDQRLDPDAVEAVIAAALGGDRVTDRRERLDVRAEPTAERLEILSGLVAIADRAELTPGARRGAARGLGGILPLLGIHLDRRRPVALVLASGADAGTIVEIGDYLAVGELVGQILQDERAQLVLGVMIGTYRYQQHASIVASIEAGTAADPGTATHMIGAALADVTRVLELVTIAQNQHHDLALFEFGLQQRQVQQLLSALGITAALFSGPAGPLVLRASQLVSLSTGEIMRAVAPDGARPVGQDLQSSAAIQFSAVVMGVVTRNPSVRAAVGLDGVDADLWIQISEQLEIIETEPLRAGNAQRTLEALVATSPELDTYLETVRAISGEDSLG
jgi:hypothetical protein